MLRLAHSCLLVVSDRGLVERAGMLFYSYVLARTRSVIRIALHVESCFLVCPLTMFLFYVLSFERLLVTWKAIEKKRRHRRSAIALARGGGHAGSLLVGVQLEQT
jgi:hypothetical protein